MRRNSSLTVVRRNLLLLLLPSQACSLTVVRRTRRREEGGGRFVKAKAMNKVDAGRGWRRRKRFERERERALLGTMVHNGGSKAAPAHGLGITTRFAAPHP